MRSTFSNLIYIFMENMNGYVKTIKQCVGKKVNTSDSDLSFKMGLVSQAETTSFY